MIGDLEIPFDRVTYRDRQLLTALDLRDQIKRDMRLRWLHTHYLHDTWGIALGFTVQADKEQAAVLVGPGYAVDEIGRDIVLAEGRTLPVPKGIETTPLVLTVRYQEDVEFRKRIKQSDDCLRDGFNPRQEQPIFAWQRADEARFGQHVPLALALVGRENILALDFRVRRYARPLARPYIGDGITEPGRTGWRYWPEAEPTGLEVVVDTSEAGFVDTPAYFPLLHSDFGALSGESGNSSLKGFSATFFPNALNFVTNPTPESFTYRIIQTGESVSPAQAERRQWHLSWVGLEPIRGCEPTFSRSQLLREFLVDRVPSSPLFSL